MHSVTSFASHMNNISSWTPQYMRSHRVGLERFFEIYLESGWIHWSEDMYLICENEYLRWLTSICPYTQVDQGSVKGHFSLNLECVRKDVECTFGMMKKQWCILHRLHYRNIRKCENIFVSCSCVNNFLIYIMETNIQQCHLGGSIDINDGMRLDRHTPNNPKNSGRSLEYRFSSRSRILSNHLHVFWQRGAIIDIEYNTSC